MIVKNICRAIWRFFVRTPSRDPKADALSLRIRWNGLATKVTNLIRQLEIYAKDYLSQAVEAKRTGDAVALSALKNQFAIITHKRHEMERLLHGIRFISTNLSVKECLVDFYGVVKETSISLDGEMSSENIVQAEENFSKMLHSFQGESARMDQLLQVMDAGMATAAASTVAVDPQRDAAFEAAVADLAARRDVSVEIKLKDLLQRP